MMMTIYSRRYEQPQPIQRIINNNGWGGNGAIVHEEKWIPWPVAAVVFPPDVESTHAVASPSPRELCSRHE
jgi:hypothetical protein